MSSTVQHNRMHRDRYMIEATLNEELGDHNR